jgi:ribosome maturation factor RimP
VGLDPAPRWRARSTGIRAFPTIAELIEPTLRDLGFELVRARFMKGARSTTLQVMAEPIDRRRGMTVDDCAEISHALSAVLDVADAVAGPYRLEVSSPGIDRPLVKAEDFARFAGQAARIELVEPQDGRKKFRGVLAGLDGETVLIDIEGERQRIPHARIAKARLVPAEGLLGGQARGARRRRA